MAHYITLFLSEVAILELIIQTLDNKKNMLVQYGQHREWNTIYVFQWVGENSVVYRKLNKIHDACHDAARP